MKLATLTNHESRFAVTITKSNARRKSYNVITWDIDSNLTLDTIEKFLSFNAALNRANDIAFTILNESEKRRQRFNTTGE